MKVVLPVRFHFTRRLLPWFLSCALALGSAGDNARAQQAPSLSFLRDAEIEADLRAMAAPLWRTAGLQPDAVSIILINDRTLNAFVAGGQNIFVHSGLLLRARGVSEVLGVLAHETGHIAHGDLAKLPEARRSALATTLLSTLAGAAAAIASGQPEAAAGGVLAGQSMAARNFFAFSRSAESAADQAGISYLDANHLSSQGLLNFMETLEHEEALSPHLRDPYLLTHPLTTERIDILRNHAVNSPWTSAPIPPETAERFNRLRAKLAAFLNPPQQTLNRIPANDPTIAARYGRAIAYYRQADLARALPLIEGLIAAEPKNPYFYELKGQMLFENGRVADAVAPYQRAANLAPESALIGLELAQTQIETEDPALLPPSVTALVEASHRERDIPLLWRLLAVGYGRLGQLGQAAVAQAEESSLLGNQPRARDEARRAMRLLAQGSPGWLRAQDLDIAATNALDQR